MKRIFVLFLVITSIVRSSLACGGYDGDYRYYYEIFRQELINDPRYFPFLLMEDSPYYESDRKIENENIREWQQFLGLSYKDAEYLVFKATREQVRSAINGTLKERKNLEFLTPAFVNKHKQALLYIAYAKYLEPYMRISHYSADDWDYFPEDTKTADQLDYDEVMNVLRKSWEFETEKELKLRYGYQMVRFAHYNREYDEAIQLFDKYVESLNYKPAMYYHALAQKAGAMYGAGYEAEPNFLFLQVFANSDNLKAMAHSSMTLNRYPDFNLLLEQAKTENERNDAMLLIGFTDFSNPLPMVEKIIKTSPNAIQAKVLMARAIKQIESDLLPVYITVSKTSDRAFPLKRDDDFFRHTLSIVKKQTQADEGNKDFWNILSAYLHLLDRNYTEAKSVLKLVSSTSEGYQQQKADIMQAIAICEPQYITGEIEEQWHAIYNRSDFERDVIANKYFLQKEYAKSFIVSNEIQVLENNPDLYLIDEIEKLYHKPNKNKFEQKLLNDCYKNAAALSQYLNYLRGVACLSKGELDNALAAFKKSAGEGEKKMISSKIFGYNQIECFMCEDIIGVDYLEKFGIDEDFNYYELTLKLVELHAEGQTDSELSVKANYLLGNFFYNTCNGGYFREILRFELSNSYSWDKYNRAPQKNTIYDGAYFKRVDCFYNNTHLIAQKYLEKAYAKAKQTTDDELKARIAFALSKCELREYEETDGSEVFITGRIYFKELSKYKNTAFFEEVKTNCNYFEYYVNNL